MISNEVRATLRGLRVSPRKVRVLCDLVRGSRVQKAIDSFKFSKRPVAKPLISLLFSAVSNASFTLGLDLDRLYLKSVFVDQGSSYKRSLSRARGVSTPILKKTSSVTVVLAEK